LRVSAPAQDPPSSVRATPERAPAAASTRAGADTVDLRSDADLDAFVRRLFQLFDNPKHRADILSGRRRFRLAGGPSTGAAEAVQRVDRGAVTEAHIKQAAAAGARLVLGVRAVMTPLARDRARALGVVVDKER
jgi:hypothetical protein